MLANSDDRGPLKVFLVTRSNEHDEALIEAARAEQGNLLATQNLAAALRCMGVAVDSSKSHNAPRRANLTSVEDEVTSEVGIAHGGEANESEEDEVNDNVTLQEVFNTFKKRQRAPPKGGCPFPKNDHIATKIGKAPPSPCKVCGSANHWDRECPDWSIYVEKQKQGVLSAPGREQWAAAFINVAVPESAEATPCALAAGHKTEINTFEEVDQSDISAMDTRNLKHSCSPEGLPKLPEQSARKAHIVEIEDEYWANEAKMPKARCHIIEGEDNWSDAEESELTEETDMRTNEDIEDNDTPPPPSELGHIVLRKKRNPKSGDLAIRVLVLSMKGWIESLDNEAVDLRLDSGADITLVSEEFYNSLKNLPKIR
ncbi:hypothetical protein C8R44DRAFT_729682 [Mycena epipterygia]|nr:hypothetical protein C8R44DRAFT_729682 [Mycena epipterygia]